MKFGPKRNHVMFIFERFFRDFGLLILALIWYVITRDYEVLIDHAGVLVIVFFSPISRLIQYLCTYYTIDDECLLVEKGWLNKKKQEVPISNITTVDFSQNIFFQMAKVCSVNIDNNSSIGTGSSGKVKMVLKEKDAVFVKGLLLAKKAGISQEQELRRDRISEETSGNTIMASSGEILMLGLLRSKAGIVIQLIAYSGVAVGIISQLFLEKKVDGQQVILEWLLHFTGPILILCLLLALYLIGTAVSVVLDMIRYYGFRITDRGESIFIEYGLFTRKTFTLVKEKISGVSYQQPLLMRLLRRGSLEVFAAGYGDGDDDDLQETAILYPVMKQEKLYAFLGRFFPELKTEPDFVKAQPKSIPYFFLCGRFLFSLLLFLAALVIQAVLIPQGMLQLREAVAAAGIFFVLAAIVSVLLEYANASVSAADQVVAVTCGSYTKKTVLIKTSKLETVEETASTRKHRRKHIANIRLGVLAPGPYSHHKVRNVETKMFEAIREKLVY